LSRSRRLATRRPLAFRPSLSGSLSTLEPRRSLSGEIAPTGPVAELVPVPGPWDPEWQGPNDGGAYFGPQPEDLGLSGLMGDWIAGDGPAGGSALQGATQDPQGSARVA
jgi:hypothetical protein